MSCSSATWTRPGLGRWAARVAALMALLPLVDLLLGSIRSALQLSRAAWTITAEHDAGLFLVAAVLALASGKLGTIAWSRARFGELRIDDAGIVITSAGRERRIPLASIQEGLITGAEDDPSLILHLRGGAQLTVALEDEADAEEALGALKLGPDRKRFTMTSAPGRALALGCVGIGLGPMTIMWAWAFMPAAWLGSRVFAPLMCTLSITLMALFARLSWPRAVTIGAEGIGIKGGFRDRFIPYDRLVSASCLSSTGGLDLTISAKEQRDGSTARELEFVTVDGYRTEVAVGAVRRIKAAKEAFTSTGSTPDLSALDPEGKRLDAWMAGLGALARETGASYRRPSVSVESLVEVLDRPDTEAGRRIGAAIALKGSGYEGAAARIRIAAESVASEEMRAALTNIAEEEEASLTVVKEALRRTL